MVDKDIWHMLTQEATAADSTGADDNVCDRTLMWKILYRHRWSCTADETRQPVHIDDYSWSSLKHTAKIVAEELTTKWFDEYGEPK